MWLLLACDDERSARAPDDEVDYGGYVYESPASFEDEARLSDASVWFFPEGGEPVPAEQRFEEHPGFWTVTLPRDVPISVLIDGPELYRSVWAGVAPHAHANWFGGRLFGAERGFVDGWFEELEVEGILPFDAGVVHVWGVPLEPEGWDCAAVRVNEAPVLCFSRREDGTMGRVDAGPFEHFFAFNLAPGQVRVDGGRGVLETYDTAGGELVYAFWLSQGEDG